MSTRTRQSVVAALQEHPRLATRLLKVRSGCMEWQGTRNNCGYGKIKWEGRMLYVHRVVWLVTRGYPPKGGLIRHKCDNRACGNPLHLQQGDYSANLRDQYRRGRR